LPPLNRNDTFNLNYKSFTGLESNNMQSMAGYSGGNIGHSGYMPDFANIDFTGQYRDKLLQQGSRANMPHMKRIIN